MRRQERPRDVIPARKHRWFTRWFTAQARGRLRRTFSSVRVQGLDALRALTDAEPLVVVSNHTAWWDPLVVLYLQELLANETYAMMNAQNLERLPFFALVGAFGVDVANPADGASAMRYAARLLDRPRRLVWIFPQGAERPVTLRPLGFRLAAPRSRGSRSAARCPSAFATSSAATSARSCWCASVSPSRRSVT
ncbi:MAG: lysophospholipid acyltransferase family protein [Polyangiales bacterium]